ncbi:transmembrane protein 18 [Toxorhynchites rutilus septentrionalis]|uniref:transmembrane protein 18 n=1 Tax=Toxorhynchites rutilus septentrionalis TaxID=329112 RepID=UPI00247A6EB1|nr:transmembrane protein 18 [Toxorhynchites rutilus septentrionalis]
MIDPNYIEINEIKGFLSFIQSIDWYDPWLIGLIAFHICITTTAVLTRKCGNFQVFLFLVLLLMVYFSESINEYAAVNWRIFSKQQYFDDKGLFISVVFSVPILLNCMLMVGSWHYQSTQLMTRLKTAQLRQQIRQSNNRRRIQEQKEE